MKPFRYPALFVLAASVAAAQTATDPRDSRSASNAGGAIVLSPFTVNTDKDVGYLGYDSLAGGRLSTELLKTPSDVTVLTKDFITDISATNYQEAANYLTNAYTSPQLNTDFGNAVTFRGLTGGFPTRNYFRYINVIDYFVAERMEGARGPNAILFGDGAVGGVVNTLTKRANLSRAFTELGVRADSGGLAARHAGFTIPRTTAPCGMRSLDPATAIRPSIRLRWIRIAPAASGSPTPVAR